MASPHSSEGFFLPGGLPSPISATHVVPGTPPTIVIPSSPEVPEVQSPSANLGQGTGWCWTMFNYTADDISRIIALPYRYLVFGFETCPTTDRRHLQGYIQFRTRKRFRPVQQLLTRCHITKAIGSAYQNREYCIKDGDFQEFGTVPVPPGHAGGAATAAVWENVRALAVAGRISEIPAEYFIRYYGTLKRIAKDYMSKPTELLSPCGLWIHGDTGSGKTYAVTRAYPNRYIKPMNKWWDGYQGEDVVHLDEVSPHQTPWIAYFLKMWSDAYPFAAEEKGGAMQIRPKLFIVTSNYTIDQMGFAMEDLAPLKRRFKEVYKERSQTIII